MQIVHTINQESKEPETEKVKEVFACLSLDLVVKDLNFPTGNIVKVYHIYDDYDRAMAWLKGSKHHDSRIITTAYLPEDKVAEVARAEASIGITLKVVRGVVE